MILLKVMRSNGIKNHLWQFTVIHLSAEITPVHKLSSSPPQIQYQYLSSSLFMAACCYCNEVLRTFLHASPAAFMCGSRDILRRIVIFS